jgi:hypothetical protein
MAAYAVGAAVRLGLADLIDGGQGTAVELAAASGADEASVLRLLRALAALEVLTEDQPGTFVLSPMGELLCTGRPDSMHAFVRMFCDPAMMGAWQRLTSSARPSSGTAAA